MEYSEKVDEYLFNVLLSGTLDDSTTSAADVDENGVYWLRTVIDEASGVHALDYVAECIAYECSYALPGTGTCILVVEQEDPDSPKIYAAGALFNYMGVSGTVDDYVRIQDVPV